MTEQILGGTPTAIVSGTGPITKHVVLLHGYGADKADLLPIANLLSPYLPAVKWWLPNGFEGLTDVPFGFSGRQWFKLDRSRLDSLYAKRDFDAVGRLFGPGLDSARERILQFLKAIDVPLTQLVLAGFSQGAMVATHTASQLPAGPAGLIALSGVMMPQNGWEEAFAHKPMTAVFQSHGRQDAVLPFELAEKLRDVWTKNNLRHDFVAFNGGHEIPQEVCKGMLQFLQSF